MKYKATSALSVFVLFALVTSSANAASWVFVSLLQKKQIVAFERDAESGNLQQRTVTNCPAEPACSAVSADGRVLYVSFRSTGQLAAYRINFDSGQLALINRVEGGEDPAYLLPDRTGQYLLSAYYAANKICVHELSKEGAISERPMQTIATAEKAHGIAIDSTQQSVFVPHTGSNRIYQFRFDEGNGLLKASDPPFISTPAENHPRHIALHPSDQWAYVSNEAGDSISVYSVDTAAAVLAPLQTEPTIPADFDGSKNATARIEMTPNGRFVYVANRGHHSLAGFAIEQKTGQVKSLGQFPTEGTPRSFTISSDSRFLYAAGQGSGRLAAFRIGADGKLSRFATYDSGPVSWWAIAVDDKD